MIDSLGYPKTKPVQRCLISDLQSRGAPRLDKLRDNRSSVPLAVSALARSRADSSYGINMTAPATLLRRKGRLQRAAVGRSGAERRC